MPGVVHLEIPAEDPQRAVEFYTQVFNWKVEEWGTEDYWLRMTDSQGAPGIDGAILKRPPTFRNVVNSIGVKSLDEYTEKVKAHGGKILEPKMEIAGVGWVAYFSDTEGNVHGIYQSIPQQ